jgi:hypothetical protein
MDGSVTFTIEVSMITMNCTLASNTSVRMPSRVRSPVGCLAATY